MYILNQSKTEIHNSDFFDHFLIVEKSDAKLIVASRGRDTQPYTLRRYINMQEAREVIESMFQALYSGVDRFEMPLSCIMAGYEKVKDARVRRKGGS